jgi:hypothetical protein
MAKLILPKPPVAAESGSTTAEAGLATTTTLLLTRREFLGALAAIIAASAVPLRMPAVAWAAGHRRFFNIRERGCLRALCERVIPADHDPGARKLGAHRYIEHLLTALEQRTPRLFARGPYSNRNRYPDNEVGAPRHRRPRNEFRRFIALTRLQELEWRAELYGSAAVPEIAALDTQFGGPLVGLRDLYRSSLATVDALAESTYGRRYAALDDGDQDALFVTLDDGVFPADPRRDGRTFMDILIQHTLEGCFAAPEYGGNRHGRGWKMIGLEGDSQPLGYSIYSTETDSYHERPDHPMTTPNPDELVGGVLTPIPLTADGQHVQDSIITLTSIFSSGIC